MLQLHTAGQQNRSHRLVSSLVSKLSVISTNHFIDHLLDSRCVTCSMPAAMQSQQQQLHKSSGAPGQQQLWYFAYGSMCNLASLNRRSLYPAASHPAALPGYKLAFQLGECASGCCLCVLLLEAQAVACIFPCCILSHITAKPLVT
jgi:hypothetical protein